MSESSFFQAFGMESRSQAESGSSLQRVFLERSAFEKIVEHWRNLPADRLPNLRGISFSSADSSRFLLNMVFDLTGEGPFVCLEADLRHDQEIPDLSGIWPYCAWWQEELQEFSKLKFNQNGLGKGVKWRQI